MRVVLDTNLFLSAMLSDAGPPARIVAAWGEQRFELVTSEDQIAEVKRAARYAKLRPLVPRAALGRLVNALRSAEIVLKRLPRAGGARDPADDYLLAMAIAVDTEYLVTGDRALLSVERIAVTRIVTPRRFVSILER